MFRVPRGFKGLAPAVYEEQQEWVADGLIPPFFDDDNADEVLAGMLRAVRKHMKECKCEK